MKLLIIAQMLDKKLYDMFVPLLKSGKVSSIHILRREKGIPYPGVKYHHLPEPYGNSVILGFVYLFFVGVYLNFKIKPNLIISYNFFPYGLIGILIKLIKDTKLISCIIGTDRLKFSAKLGGIFKFFISKSDAIVTTGSRTKNMIANELKSLYSSQNIYGIHMANYGSTNHPSMGQNTNSHLDVPIVEREHDFAFIGDFLPVKQIDMILKVFKKVVEINKSKTLVLMGNGPLFNDLKVLAENLGLTENCSFTGYVYNPWKYLSNSKFLIIASKSEGFPAVLIEGMSVGCIPIASDIGDIPDLVNSENGVLYKSSEDSSLYENNLRDALIEAINFSHDKLDKLSQNAKKVRESHNYRQSSKQWLDVIMDVIKSQ